MSFDYKHKVTVAGHRGDLDHYPENTMRSFVSAIEKGADMIETDIHLSKDGIPVLIHDDTVDRTTDGTGNVCDKTLAELRILNAGTPDDVQRIPTLDEFLELAAKENILVNLEIKVYYDGTNEDVCQQAADKTVALAEKYNLASKSVFTSFDASALEYLHKKYKGKYRLQGFYPYSIMRNNVMNPEEYLYSVCMFDSFVPEYYKYLKDHKIESWLGSGIKEKQDFERAVKLGGNLFTSNDPGNAIEILKELGLR